MISKLAEAGNQGILLFVRTLCMIAKSSAFSSLSLSTLHGLPRLLINGCVSNSRFFTLNVFRKLKPELNQQRCNLAGFRSRSKFQP